jgi:hypothetical protein
MESCALLALYSLNQMHFKIGFEGYRRQWFRHVTQILKKLFHSSVVEMVSR